MAQVVVRPVADGFELRHVADEAVSAEALRPVAIPDLRALAQHTADGVFRPLKAAPNLAQGWRATAGNFLELERALEQLYPGALADWFAVDSNPAAPPVTSYREYTARQSGMYRITTQLNDAAAARMVAACCDAASCLKRRLWTVPGLAPEDVAGKSIIPCLEPCAVLLEFARKAARWEQADRSTLALAAEEIQTVQEALQLSLAQPPAGAREADFSQPLNPRRVRWILSRLDHLSPRGGPEKEGD